MREEIVYGITLSLIALEKGEGSIDTTKLSLGNPDKVCYNTLSLVE